MERDQHSNVSRDDNKKTDFQNKVRNIRNVNSRVNIGKALATKENFAKNYGNETWEYLKNFEKNQNQIKNTFIGIKDENQHFSKYYKKIEERRTQLHKKKHDKGSKVEETFKNLILQYKDKGYKIPDLSVKNNLFKPSPLLMENSKLIGHYKFFTRENIENDKDQKFIDKLRSIITDKQIKTLNDDNEKSNEIFDNKSSLYQRRLSIGFVKRLSVFKKMPKTKEQIEVDNKKLLSENKHLRKLTQDLRNKEYSFEKMLSNNIGRRVSNRSSSFNLNIEQIKGINSPKNLKSIKTIASENFQKTRNVDRILRKSIVNNNNQFLTTNLTVSTTGTNTKSNKIVKGVSGNPEGKIYYFDTHENLKLPKKKRHTSIISFPQEFILTINNESPVKLESLYTQNNLHQKSLSSVTTSTHYVNKDKKSDKKSLYHNKARRSNSRGSNEIEAQDKINSFIEYVNLTTSNNEINKEKEETLNMVLKELYENKKNYLDHCVDKLDINKMSLNDLKDVMAEYCRKFIGYNDKQIEEVIDRKVEPSMLWNMINEIKNKVETLDVKDTLSEMYPFKEVDRKITLDKIKHFDNTLKTLNQELIRKIYEVHHKK